jgi:hypothetical protein
VNNIALAFAGVLLVGCTAAPTIAVDIETSSRRGRGVIVGPRTVLTVCHVVDGSNEVVVDGLRARVIARRRHTTETGEDGLAIVELEEGVFPPERIGQLADKVGTGVSYLPRRGECAWPWGLQPGDSGSPILDARGRVTGLVRAVFGRAEPIDRSVSLGTNGDS